MSDLITRLVPILHVQDPDAERRFYEQPGLRTTCGGPRYPGFIVRLWLPAHQTPGVPSLSHSSAAGRAVRA
jgi:hypothetical protein